MLLCSQALERLNAKLEEENKQLIFQLQALLQQNQELLTQTLESSEHFREEEQAYRDQLVSLQRVKDQLENKIMEQYKDGDRYHMKKKGFRHAFVQFAKGFVHKVSSLDGSAMYTLRYCTVVSQTET